MTFWKNYTWRQEKNLEAYRLRHHKQSFIEAYLSSKCKFKIISAFAWRKAVLAPANTILHSLIRMKVPKENAVLYIVANREISVWA